MATNSTKIFRVRKWFVLPSNDSCLPIWRLLFFVIVERLSLNFYHSMNWARIMTNCYWNLFKHHIWYSSCKSLGGEDLDYFSWNLWMKMMIFWQFSGLTVKLANTNHLRVKGISENCKKNYQLSSKFAIVPLYRFLLIRNTSKNIIYKTI